MTRFMANLFAIALRSLCSMPVSADAQMTTFIDNLMKRIRHEFQSVAARIVRAAVSHSATAKVSRGE
jgi:hypothetical protein